MHGKILKSARFSGKGRQSLIYKRYENSLMLIYCVKLDHVLYTINYGISPSNHNVIFTTVDSCIIYSLHLAKTFIALHILDSTQYRHYKPHSWHGDKERNNNYVYTRGNKSIKIFHKREREQMRLLHVFTSGVPVVGVVMGGVSHWVVFAE